jgi:hypothetical protein
MTFKSLLNEDQRYVILRLLSEDTDYSVNEAVLRRALELSGHAISQDQLRTHLAWLVEQDLLKVESIGSGLQIATLTSRGMDVAQSRTVVPGVARPMPGL